MTFCGFQMWGFTIEKCRVSHRATSCFSRAAEAAKGSGFFQRFAALISDSDWVKFL